MRGDLHRRRVLQAESKLVRVRLRVLRRGVHRRHVLQAGPERLHVGTRVLRGLLRQRDLLQAIWHGLQPKRHLLLELVLGRRLRLSIERVEWRRRRPRRSIPVRAEGGRGELSIEGRGDRNAALGRRLLAELRGMRHRFDPTKP